jgi:hypothetical protein
MRQVLLGIDTVFHAYTGCVSINYSGTPHPVMALTGSCAALNVVV